jgi:hypothetical protein
VLLTYGASTPEIRLRYAIRAFSIGLSDGRPTGPSAMNTVYSSEKMDRSASLASMPPGPDTNEVISDSS